MGNIYAFTGADVHGRYQRLRGHDVFEPIGFDAFGIHSENFALKRGVHPMDLIPSNVRNFTRQLRRIGGMFDWDHTVDTTDPAYYKWTQWIFLQLFKAGLAERKEAPVNWCPSCKTVLANEQVIAGACERCGTPVEQRRIAQWFFKITRVRPAPAGQPRRPSTGPTPPGRPRELDRPERGRRAALPRPGRRRQRDRHAASTSSPPGPTPSSAPPTWCWRPSTRWWTRSPTTASAAPWSTYRDEAARKDLVARQKVDKTKTGVFTGGYCRNPATGEADPDLDRRLRAHGVRHRRHHGRARPRRARLRVRHGVRPAHRARGGRCRRRTPTRRWPRPTSATARW